MIELTPPGAAFFIFSTKYKVINPAPTLPFDARSLHSARPPLVMDDAGSEDARSVTPRRRGGECPTITEDTLGKIQNVVILEKEGIVYCPIPKVSSSSSSCAV